MAIQVNEVNLILRDCELQRADMQKQIILLVSPKQRNHPRADKKKCQTATLAATGMKKERNKDKQGVPVLFA